MVSKGRYCCDIESNGLLDNSTVDYTASPWRLKDNFVIHCIVATDIDTGEVFEFVQQDCYTKFKQFVLDNVKEVSFHNGINFDMLACKAALDMDYSVEPDTWCGKPVFIHDTLVLSKVLSPDRPSHSIDYFGKLLGFPKIDWRAKAVELGLIEYNAPRGAEFAIYHPEMLNYCKQDVLVGSKTLQYLLKEWGDWDWADAYSLEKQVADIITRQSHRGFKFDYDLAIQSIKELDLLMIERKERVEPNLPMKPMGATKLKGYIPCKNQFLKSGQPSTNIQKWIEKHNGKLEEVDGKFTTTLYGKDYTLPIPQEPILDKEPSHIDDTTFIKGILVEMGWSPTQYKERDLTVDTKKHKLTQEKFEATVDRYVEQTLSSPFCKDRCEKVGVSASKLKEKLLKHDPKKPLKVYTNPTLTVGQEKEIDPELEKLGEAFPYVQDIIEYLTYKHRRNSILGGGTDPEEWEEDDDATSKGFLANYRDDGRIPTPADTCGASTGRMLHRICANIPRVTSLYGKPMRSMFGVDTEKCYQYAYDFASLEGRIEAHYCWRYDEADKAYCYSLIQDKPNDVHTVTAKKISELIGQAFPRQSAKSVKYCTTYGGQAPRVAKTIGCSLHVGELVFNAFWEAAFPLASLKEKVEAYWKTGGGKKYVLGIDGRKINTRSQHALLNSLFQSGGVICAKRVMVFQDKLYKAKGLIVDFWKEDWKNKSYVQQLIAYHDEAQFEVTRDLVTWKTFPTEEEMKAWKEVHPEWINPVEKNGKWYLAHSIVNDITMEAVALTNEYYKLKVPLAVDPQYGRNWAECH